MPSSTRAQIQRQTLWWIGRCAGSRSATIVLLLILFRDKVSLALAPLAAALGYFLYNEPTSLFVFLGAAFVFAGNLLNIRGQRRMTMDRDKS